MLRIGVLDDEKEWRKTIKYKAEKYLSEIKEDFLISIFSCGKDLLESVNSIELVFIDIEMPDESGLEIAKSISKLNKKIKIVFVSWHEKYVYNAFKVNAYRFINKDFKNGEIEDVLREYYIEKDIFFNINVYVSGKKVTLNSKEIFMIEATKNGTILYTKDRELFCRNTMIEWEESLCEERFFRTHKSFIIHLYWIKKIGKSIKLENEFEAMISRRKKKEFEKRYLEFIERYSI